MDGPLPVETQEALQQRADSPEARFLLGRALLESGDGVAAAVELKKARELKHPDVDVLPPLARALLRQGEFKTITGDFAADDAESFAPVLDALSALEDARTSLKENAHVQLTLEALFLQTSARP